MQKPQSKSERAVIHARAPSIIRDFIARKTAVTVRQPYAKKAYIKSKKVTEYDLIGNKYLMAGDEIQFKYLWNDYKCVVGQDSMFIYRNANGKDVVYSSLSSWCNEVVDQHKLTETTKTTKNVWTCSTVHRAGKYVGKLNEMRKQFRDSAVGKSLGKNITTREKRRRRRIPDAKFELLDSSAPGTPIVDSEPGTPVTECPERPSLSGTLKTMANCLAENISQIIGTEGSPSTQYHISDFDIEEFANIMRALDAYPNYHQSENTHTETSTTQCS